YVVELGSSSHSHGQVACQGEGDATVWHVHLLFCRGNPTGETVEVELLAKPVERPAVDILLGKHLERVAVDCTSCDRGLQLNHACEDRLVGDSVGNGFIA